MIKEKMTGKGPFGADICVGWGLSGAGEVGCAMLALMAQIEIGTETEGSNHWAYQVTVSDDGQRHQYQVTLGWSDYDLWSHGRLAPEKVVRAVFEFLLQREPASSILPRFDCSVVRRYFPEVDQELPRLI
jgi:hypothetical protein